MTVGDKATLRLASVGPFLGQSTQLTTDFENSPLFPGVPVSTDPAAPSYPDLLLLPPGQRLTSPISVRQAPCFDSARAVGSQDVGSALHVAPEAEPMEAAQAGSSLASAQPAKLQGGPSAVSV